jgi:hypothetical protein
MTTEPCRAARWTGPAGLPADIKARKVQIIVVYKVDRLTRSLADFAKIVESGREARRGAPRSQSRIAEKIEEVELDPDQAAPLDKLIGKDYDVITADERLGKIAADFVEHCATRWESGWSAAVTASRPISKNA